MSMQPNLTKYTIEEIKLTLEQIDELENQGKDEEADALSLRCIPMNADRANILKQSLGIDYLIENEVNLSKAVEKFGENWLVS